MWPRRNTSSVWSSYYLASQASVRFTTHRYRPNFSLLSIPLLAILTLMWRLRSASSVSSSTRAPDDLGWPSPTCWDGDPISHQTFK